MNRDVLDAMNVLSFLLGIENLNQNMTQNDKQDLVQQLDNKTTRLLNEIHAHLELQDKKLDKILQNLEA